MNRVIIFLAGFVSLLLVSMFFMGMNGMQIERTVVINSASKVVWQHLVDAEKLRLWNPEILKDEPLDGLGLAVGAKSRMTLDEGGQPGIYINELTEVRVERKLSLAISGEALGKSPMLVSYVLTEKSGATEVNFSSRWNPSEFIMTVFTPIIKMAAENNADLALSRLKKVVESN